MKKLKALLLLLVAMLCLGCVTACSDFTAMLKPDVSSSMEESESTGDGSSTEEESGSTEEESASTEEESESTEDEDLTEDENGSTGGEEDKPFGDGYETITVAQALELCGEVGNVTTEEYYIIATIDTVSNAMYGAMTISDETGSISVYNTKGADRTTGYADLTEKPVKGDKVLLSCILQNYNDTKEVKQAYIIDFEKAVIDESDYVEMTVADARGAEKGALVKVSGVVAQITYAFGQVPNGVMLIDETQSIYVFDKDLAGSVKEGNAVTILATKDYWILDSEMASAQKHGYKGCNQLTDATLLSNDGKVNAFSTKGIEENTLKNIVENPIEEDITSIVYKVNALVKKVVGTGFTNYYFFDIDGETGGYTYTQCSGADFAWLDKFDGKICTVYLTALNAKSSATGCFYRFLPVEVEDNGYKFDTANAPQFALDYYAVDQFEEVYTADPALELVTTVSSELLGFEGVTLTYSSNNQEVVYFETAEGKTVMHCGELGKATVTVKAVYNGQEKQQTIDVTVEKAATYEYITVAEAIATAADTEGIIVKGAVGPSLVNKDGFYLFGEDGSMIAVVVNSTDDLVGLEIGHEIIIKGMRERYVKDDANTIAGQTCIVNAELLVNNYGTHEYSTEKFVDSTAADFYGLDETVDYSTTVFVLKATINYVDTGYYTTLNLSSGSTKLTLYMSGAGQYSWMKDYYGKEVTLEIAACNWNDKTFWAGCALAIRLEDGTKILNTLNFDSY